MSSSFDPRASLRPDGNARSSLLVTGVPYHRGCGKEPRPWRARPTGVGRARPAVSSQLTPCQPPGMLVGMATLDDDTEFVSAIYYGPPGTGKTTCAAFMANLGTVKYIRTDRGLRKRPLTNLGVPISNIEPVDNIDPISLERTIEEWRGMLADEPGSLAGVVLDTATEFVGRRIEVYVDRDWKTHVVKSKAAHTEIDRLDRYTSGDVRDQYLGVTQEGRRMIRHLRDLPCHLAITAQLRYDQGQTTPDVSPALRGDLISYCDFVIRLEQQGEWPDGRPLVVGFPKPDSTHVAKDRDGVLPRIFADPTFTRLIQYARGELQFKTDPIQLEYKQLLADRKAQDDEEFK